MRGVSAPALVPAIENGRTAVQATARLCSGNFGKVCRALWPEKTAEHLAARVGCAVRTAHYKISGEREATAFDLAVLVFEITKRE